MKNDLLKKELKELQLRYKEVLLKATDNIFTSDSVSVIDEINIFWQQNKKLAQFVLKNYVKPYSTYAFTAATILDVEDLEHYPFVSLGQFHVWDDPIYKYAKMVGKTYNSQFDEKMKRQVIATIADNLKLLDIAEDIIYILPIRYLSNDNSELVYKMGMQVFLSLFQGDINFEEYKKSFYSIKDVKDALRPGIERNIIFIEYEDMSIDFETRFSTYKSTTSLPLPESSSDAQIFWFAIFSYLSQASDILLMCTEYQLNPYIRFDVAFKYILILAGNFHEHKEIQEIIFKSAIAHILHRTFDKSKVKHIDFKRYYKTVQKVNFDERLFFELKRQGITMDNPNIKLTTDIINNLFYSIFQDIV